MDGGRGVSNSSNYFQTASMRSDLRKIASKSDQRAGMSLTFDDLIETSLVHSIDKCHWWKKADNFLYESKKKNTD